MRNIKFRIWDKVNKLFIYMDHVTIKAHNLNKYTDGKIRLGLELGYTNYDCPVVETIPRYQDDYIVQISTGIKDKNGKEIKDIGSIKIRWKTWEYHYKLDEIIEGSEIKKLD